MHLVQSPTPLRVREGIVLLASADRQWLASTTAFLVSATRALSTAETAAEAVEAAMRQPPDVAVIAPPLGEGSPLNLIAQLTPLRDHLALGIVYVSEREREFSEHVRLMRAGANDWFPRGIPAPEAANRIAALMEEIRSSQSGRPLRRGPLLLDFAARHASVSGLPLSLSDREFDVLSALARSTGRLMTASEIAIATGARRGPNTGRIIAECVATLHDKLGAARGLLESSRRHGYRLRFVAPP